MSLILTLAEIKSQLRLDAEDTSEDGDLSLYAQAALETVLSHLNRNLYESEVPVEDVNGMLINGSIKLAMRILVGHWYANREPIVTGTIVSDVPLSFNTLLSPYRISPI